MNITADICKQLIWTCALAANLSRKQNTGDVRGSVRELTCKSLNYLTVMLSIVPWQQLLILCFLFSVNLSSSNRKRCRYIYACTFWPFRWIFHQRFAINFVPRFLSIKLEAWLWSGFVWRNQSCFQIMSFLTDLQYQIVSLGRGGFQNADQPYMYIVWKLFFLVCL